VPNDGDAPSRAGAQVGISAPASESSQAVFISYASEDAAAAERIATALSSAGIEVWFDKSELRGGDAWDRQIREQIHECRLFMPIISAHTEARIEGYFRREWKLAVDRTHDLSERVAFLIPVVIDSTSEQKADVPEAFRHVQWTRLSGGEIPPAFINRIDRLLTPKDSLATLTAASGSMDGTTASTSARPPRSSNSHIYGAIAIAVIAGAYALTNKLWPSKHSVAATAPVAQQTAPPGVTAATFNPPPHSIAVLPFVNLSGDPGQEYFSDGLTEELLNSLAAIEGLQVAARTSSFSFREHPDITTVAHKLNVGAVLEGSVRRSQHTVRVTAQLINAVTGFHLWSKTYDRDLGDVLKLQTEIATAVAEALKVTLLGDVAARIELGGTRNPAAFDAYLRGTKAFTQHQGEDLLNAIAAYTEAVRLDPTYALAFASRSIAHTDFGGVIAEGAAIQENFSKALADARQAVALAPELAEGYVALGYGLETVLLDFKAAGAAYERGKLLAPGNAETLRLNGQFAVFMGRFDAGLDDLRRAVMLDPLNPRSHQLLGQGLYYSRRYDQAITAFTEAIALDHDFKDAYGARGAAYFVLGNLEHARDSCEIKRDYWVSQSCLAVVYEKLGRRSDADLVLTAFQKASGDSAAYQYATIYAQWGNSGKALEWLETALRVRDPGLEFIKTDPLMDLLRKEPRFQAIERVLNFPN
jgi:TolB-like protein/Flp pilus assembly protein TadD